MPVGKEFEDSSDPDVIAIVGTGRNKQNLSASDRQRSVDGMMKLLTFTHASQSIAPLAKFFTRTSGNLIG